MNQTESPAPCLLLLCNFDSIPIWQTESPGPAQQLSANLLGPPESEQHWQPCSVDVGGKLHVAHLRCSHRFKGEHWCLWKCLQLVVKPLHSSWCFSLLLHGHVDWWVAQPVLALVGQLIHLLFLAGFTRSNPQFWGREGIQESEKDIGVTSKGSKLELQHEHGRFRYRAVCLTLAQSFRQVCFWKGLLFCIRVWWQKSQPSRHEN